MDRFALLELIRLGSFLIYRDSITLKGKLDDRTENIGSTEGVRYSLYNQRRGNVSKKPALPRALQSLDGKLVYGSECTMYVSRTWADGGLRGYVCVWVA